MSVLKEAYHLLPIKENRRWPICNGIYCGQSVSSFITLFVCVLCKEQKINTEAQKSVTGLQTFFLCVCACIMQWQFRVNLCSTPCFTCWILFMKINCRTVLHSSLIPAAQWREYRPLKEWANDEREPLDLVYKSHIKLKNSLGEQFWH